MIASEQRQGKLLESPKGALGRPRSGCALSPAQTLPVPSVSRVESQRLFGQAYGVHIVTDAGPASLELGLVGNNPSGQPLSAHFQVDTAASDPRLNAAIGNETRSTLFRPAQIELNPGLLTNEPHGLWFHVFRGRS